MSISSTPRIEISPCLWFDNQAEQAANFYVSIFPNSAISHITHYGKEGHELHGKADGSVMTAEFSLDGTAFTALNGGPIFKFNEAVSFQVLCHSQEEVDYYWERLGAGGDPNAQQCGWLKDRFGVSWQVVPIALNEMLKDPDTVKTQRMTRAMLQMKKLNTAALEAAFNGSSG